MELLIKPICINRRNPMANKIIKYNLTEAGTIPTYIDDGGYFPKVNSNASPQDWDMIGATVEGSDETALGELTSEAAIKSYLDSYTGDWKQPGSDNPILRTTPFDQAAAAAHLWSKKT